uniref:Uncharacterized protein n=3 Tax=Rhizophagus irregularis TaxID=588596 RepID=U9TX52_RHIID
MEGSNSSSYFTEKPLEGYIHIIIKPPELPTVPWSDSLESRLYQLYASDNIVNIFWGQNLKEDDTTWLPKFHHKTTANLKEDPKKLQKAFDEALGNELGPSFRKMHYNLVGMSTEGNSALWMCRIPDEIRGYPTDIVEACVATPYGFGASACQSYQENVMLGSSIGIIESQGTSGTFSAVIYEEMCNKIEEDKKKSALACYECGIRGNFFSKINEKYFGIDAAFCIFSNINRTLCPNKFSISPEDFKKEKLSEDIYLNDFYEFKEFDDVVDIDVFKVGKATGLTFGKLVPIYSAISIDLRNKNVEYAKKQGKIPSYNDDVDKRIFICALGQKNQ